MVNSCRKILELQGVFLKRQRWRALCGGHGSASLNLSSGAFRGLPFTLPDNLRATKSAGRPEHRVEAGMGKLIIAFSRVAPFVRRPTDASLGSRAGGGDFAL
jgi:hypothetical protein